MAINHKTLDALRRGRSAHENHLIDMLLAGRVGRREFLRHGSVLGLSLPYLASVAAAVGLEVRPRAARAAASGGTVRVANGCRIEGGVLTQVGLPRNPWALFQVVEYLRAFLFGRLGWSQLNAMLIISGAFGLFRRDLVIEVGGYRVKTIGEDMELVVRLHRHLRAQQQRYRIEFVPDPVCWTEAPEDRLTLRNQRIRWQRGLSESMSTNVGLMFNRRVPKTDARVAAYGSCDELNAALGMARAWSDDASIAEKILEIQKELVILMGELAVAQEDRVRYVEKGFKLVDQSMVDRITALIDDLESKQSVAELLDSAREAEATRIFIGSENRLFALSGSSVIAAPYRDREGRVVGVVGVIGPTRLNYARVVPMVDFTARSLGKYIG